MRKVDLKVGDVVEYKINQEDFDLNGFEGTGIITELNEEFAYVTGSPIVIVKYKEITKIVMDEDDE